MNFDNKHLKTSHRPVQAPDESVFDRLARESTISFSRKIVNQGKQHELNIEPPTESVTERIAHLERSSQSTKMGPTEILYAEMQILHPPVLPPKRSIAPKTHSPIQKLSQKHRDTKQKVAEFFSNFIKENAPRKKEQMKKRKVIINAFFDDLVNRNKSIYQKKKDKHVKQEMISVKYFEKKGFDIRPSVTPRKRATSTVVAVGSYKRARTELTKFK